MAQDFNNIPAGLKITTQIPLNIKENILNEVTLSYLGISNNLAFAYHDQLIVNCLEEGTRYMWRKVKIGEENTGLVPLDFIYPPNIISYGIDYSNKKFNFFKIPEPPIVDYPVIDGISTGTGMPVYDGLNNKKIKVSSIKSNTLTINKESDGTININSINTEFNYLKSYYINYNYSPTPLSPADGSIIRPFPSFDEARAAMIGTGVDYLGRPVSILHPKNRDATFIVQTNSETALNPTINTLTIKLVNSKLTYTGNDVYMIDSEVLYPLVLKDGNNEITENLRFGVVGNGTLNRLTAGGYIRSIGAKRGASTTINNPYDITFQIGEKKEDSITLYEFTDYPNYIWEGDSLLPNGIDLIGNEYNPPRDLKWTTQINPTNPLVFSKGNSFSTFTYAIRGKGSLYISTFVNTGLHVENTNIDFDTLTIVPYSERISVVQGNTFVPDYTGVYEPKNAPVIYAKNAILFITSILHINGGTYSFHGFKSFFKIEGFYELRGSINYDTNHYIETFFDLTTTTQAGCDLNTKTNSSNLNSRINYLIDSNVVGDFALTMPNCKVTGVLNVSKNAATAVVPITQGTLSSINSNPYISGIANYTNDSSAMATGLLRNALYFNTTINALDKI